MDELLIASVNVRDDDDNVSSHVEVVDTQDKYGRKPIRVREFVKGTDTDFYKTWHFADRIEAMSFALVLAGYGPLADNNSGAEGVKSADPMLEKLLAEEEEIERNAMRPC